MGVGNGADVENVEEKNAGVQAAGSEADAGRERSWAIAKEFSVCVRTVYRWKEIQLLGRAKPAREPKPPEKKLEEEIQRLKQSLANRTLEVDFFKGALQKVKARRQKNSDSGGMASTTKSEK